MEDPVWKSLIIVTFVSVTVHIMEITVMKVKSPITLYTDDGQYTSNIE